MSVMLSVIVAGVRIVFFVHFVDGLRSHRSPAACVTLRALAGYRSYFTLQRLFSELMVRIAVPTTGIVLSIRTGSLHSSSLR
jgi:hypothetical protein